MARLDEWVPDLPGHCATFIYCLLTKMSALVNQIQVSKFQMLLLGKISAQVKKDIVRKTEYSFTESVFLKFRKVENVI